MHFHTRTSCRICGSSNLTPVLSLGEQFVSNFVDEATADNALKAPLELVLCEASSGGCGLLQLRHTVQADLMFRRYWYRSGINASMAAALQDVADQAEKLVHLGKGDVVVDIGCNDGTLLRSYKTRGLTLVGFEPATNLIEFAQVGTSKIVNDYFNLGSFREHFGDSKAKLITSIAMFYDLDEPNEFVDDIVHVLDRDGVWILQMNYLPSMLRQNAFDNICHEHLEYYSLSSLEALLDRHDLDVFDVELNDVNGGSFRVYAKHRLCKSVGNQNDSKNRVARLRKLEADMYLWDRRIYLEFASRITLLGQKVRRFIESECQKGKRIYVYGASTKGNTLLQFWRLDHRLLVAAADRNPDKWGRKTIGTQIPVISEEQARAERPDYFLVLPWHFLDEFMKREQAFLSAGGKFIVPLPEFRLI